MPDDRPRHHTLLTAHSDKEGAEATWKRGYGFHPMLAYADQTGEALAGELRPGNAGAGTAADQIAVAEPAIQQIPEAHIEILVRVDSAGACHELIDCCHDAKIGHSVGFDLTEGVRAAITQIADQHWVCALDQGGSERPNGQVCEITEQLDLSSWPCARRTLASAIRSPGRVAGLRPEELADLAGVSVDYYTRLEQDDPQPRRSYRRIRLRAVLVRLDDDRYPLTTDHVLDAIRSGERRLLHIDRRHADEHRAEATRGIPTKKGHDRDEYPPAFSREGGRGADVRYVPSSDNRGAGSSLGNQLRRYCNGQAFRIRVTGRARLGPASPGVGSERDSALRRQRSLTRHHPARTAAPDRVPWTPCSRFDHSTASAGDQRPSSSAMSASVLPCGSTVKLTATGLAKAEPPQSGITAL